MLYFIHKRYSGPENGALPDLRSFMILRADVIFTDRVTHIKLEKRPDVQELHILAPPVKAKEEEDRRIYLLNSFGELLLKYQKEALMQIRAMLLRITDQEAHETLIREFEEYKAAHLTGSERTQNE